MLLEKEETEDGDRSETALNTACYALDVVGVGERAAEAGGPLPIARASRLRYYSS